MKFRKKPVVVEAFRWPQDRDQIGDPIWIIEALRKPWGEEGSAKIGNIDGRVVLGI